MNNSAYFTKDTKVVLVALTILNLIFTWGLAITPLLFISQVGLILFGLLMLAQVTRAYLKGEKFDIKAYLSTAFWSTLLFMLCGNFSGLMQAVFIAALNYIWLKPVSDPDAELVVLKVAISTAVIHGLPSILLFFAPGVLSALLAIPMLYDILFWSVHLVSLFFVAKALDAAPFSNIFQWRRPSKRTVAYVILGIVVFLLTSPALYVLANYAAVGGMIFSGSIIIHLLLAAVMYAIQPLVEELIARTGLLAYLKLYGIADSNPKASYAKRFMHTLVVSLLMGFVFGFMHASVVGAVSKGVSALFYHTLMGICFALVTLWSDGIEIASVFHSFHNYSVTLYYLCYKVVSNAFKPVFLIPMFIARIAATWLGVNLINWCIPSHKSEEKSDQFDSKGVPVSYKKAEEGGGSCAFCVVTDL
ncbi:CPBP family intramembrane metalloprotease [Gammaproteobacteria bacterium]|nr:CPBP family intramembrane metalloprotease [Gammaproteobacteria bacterium]